MRDMMTAVFMCIAILTIVGCDSRTAQSQNDNGGMGLNRLSVEEPRSSEYDFRRARWGDSKDEVKSSERGIASNEFENALRYETTLKSIIMSSEPEITPQEFEDALIYKATLESIPVKIVYSFDNKGHLRSAAYLIDKQPEGLVSLLIEYARELHDNPIKLSVLEEMVTWETYRSRIQLRVTNIQTGLFYEDLATAEIR